MASYLTSSSIIESVKVSGMIPSSEATFTDQELLNIANQEMKISILPNILQYHEEYFAVDSPDIPIVANKSNYEIPYRAIGGKFREVFYKDTQGQLCFMTRISPDERPMFGQSSMSNRFIYFYLKGNDVVLVPDVQDNPTGSLMFTYYMQPNELVSEDRVGTIQAISVSDDTTTFTLDSIPSSLTAFLQQDGKSITKFGTDSLLDIVQRKSGHKTISFDALPTAVNLGTKMVTFNNDDISSSIVEGDIISFSGECIIPQIPTVLHEMVVQRVLHRVMQALGDAAGVQVAAAKLGEMEKNAGYMLENRSEGQCKKANNTRGILRSAKLGRRGNWF